MRVFIVLAEPQMLLQTKDLPADVTQTTQKQRCHVPTCTCVQHHPCNSYLAVHKGQTQTRGLLTMEWLQEQTRFPWDFSWNFRIFFFHIADPHNTDVTTYLVRQSRTSLVLFKLSQLYGGPCSPPQEPGPGGGQPDILFLWLNKSGKTRKTKGEWTSVNAEHCVRDLTWDGIPSAPLFELYLFSDDLRMACNEHKLCRGTGAILQKCRPAAEKALMR